MDFEQTYKILIENGYYFGSNYDILNQYECNTLQHAIDNDINNNGLRKKFHDDYLKKTRNVWEYFMQANSTDERFQSYNSGRNLLSYDDREERKKYLDENNIPVMQQWFFTPVDVYSHIIDPNVLQNRIKEFISKIYLVPANKVDVEPIKISFYDKDDFLKPHVDGKNKGRLCSLIIYLSDPTTYSLDKGGNFLLHSKNIKYDNQLEFNDMEVSLNPTYPNYVILDFTKNNLYHAVQPCTTRFSRYAILCFPTLKE